MQFAWYLKRFGLEYLVCTVLAASWSQHLYYAGDYLQHFVLFAACCLELVFGSIGPKDQGTRGPREQGTRGPGPRKLRFFPVSSPILKPARYPNYPKCSYSYRSYPPDIELNNDVLLEKLKGVMWHAVACSHHQIHGSGQQAAQIRHLHDIQAGVVGLLLS